MSGGNDADDDGEETSSFFNLKNNILGLRHSVKFLLLLVICLCTILYVDIIQSTYNYINNPTITAIHPLKFFAHDKHFFVKTKWCRIPAMDPFDPSIVPHIKNLTKPKCNKGKPFLVDSDLDSIFLVRNSFKDYNVVDESLLKCCYKKFKRVRPEGNLKDNKVRYDVNCKIFNERTVIDDEYIKVNCTYDGKTIYTDYFAFVPIKGDESREMPTDPLNVLVIGLDTVSRLNLIRQMPKTYSYLKDELRSVDLEGYNKIGDNTFPNVMAVLTGMNQPELKRSCWPQKNSRFDNCPFIWKGYKKNGFTTLYAEDAAWMGVFNFNKFGFIEIPTDYYWSSFDREAEDNIGNEHGANAVRCVGSRLVYRTLISYINKFTTRMHSTKRPYFAFFWEVSLSHDYLNAPKWADDDYHSLFQNLTNSGRLDNTVLFFISDHGMRWGPIRSTYQGRVEERLPFVHIVVPRKYRSDNPRLYANLVKNKNRLTSPYDVHETLKDLLQPHRLTPRFLEERERVHQRTITRGYSLFDKLPMNRTCEDADISPHWCVCQETSQMSVNDTTVVESAVFAVEFMNSQLVGYADCEKLVLDIVLNAQKQVHNRETFTKHDVEDYLVTLRTIPGGGEFEATVRMNQGKRQIMGTISRVNIYGKQSACITDFHLKLYCYCKRFSGE